MKLFYLAPASSTHTRRWVSYFAQRRYEITVVSFYPADDIDGANIIYVPVFNKNAAILKIGKVKRLLAEIKPDILHAHYATSCGMVAAFSGFHPYVLSTWGDDIFNFPRRSPVHRWVVRQAIARADYLTATSRMLAEGTNALAGDSRDIEVIPFGVDLKHYQYHKREPKDCTEIGTVRNMTPKYGLNYLIDAFSKLVKDGYEARLTLVGDGYIRPDLESQVKRLKLENRVTFTGAVKNEKVVDFLDAFDIFVMPSVGEGETFGVAAVEAMATGLPVVASRVGGLHEVIDDGLTGLHVAPGDVESLSQALKKYIDSPELRLTHGRAGREKVEKEFDWLENAGRMEILYKRILDIKGNQHQL